MSYYERGAGGQLVPTTDWLPDEAVRMMERYDDDAIVQRLTTGIASEEFIYRFPIKTKDGIKEVFGVSADGASELALMIGNVEVLPDARVDKDSDPEYIYGMVRAKDVSRNVILLGVGRQCKYQIGKGNLPDHDRMDEHAFVKAITKAQRNAILHLASQEIVMRIINTFDKSGKSKQLRPPSLDVEKERPAPQVKPPAPAAVVPQARPSSDATGAPTPIPAAAAIAEQQEKLKKLRMQVHNRFQTDLGIGLEKRKTMLKDRFGKDSLTELNEQQLKECLSWIEEMIGDTPAPTPPATPAVKVQQEQPVQATMGEGNLGFESADEQGKLRGTLYSTLTSPKQLNLKDEEAKKFIADRGYSSSLIIPKDRLLEIIKEATELIKAKQIPTEF